jgi:hypothetical protein
MAVAVTSVVLRDVIPFGPLDNYRRFRGKLCLSFQSRTHYVLPKLDNYLYPSTVKNGCSTFVRNVDNDITLLP